MASSPVGKSTSGKTGWDNYGTVVKQVAAQRVARLGAQAALAQATGQSNALSSTSPLDTSTAAYNDFVTRLEAPDTSHGLGLSSIGTPFSSAWHAIGEGFNRAGSILPDIYHEQNLAHQQHLQKKDFSLGHLFSDYFHSIKKGTGEALSGSRPSDFANVFQEHADTAKANSQAKAQGEVVPNAADIKPGSGYVNPYMKGLGGFAADVVTNPLNLVGVGTVGAAEKTAEGVNALRAAKIAAPVGKKQIALKLAGHEIPTGIPAVQVAKRMAESSNPKVTSLLDKFQPLANAINNPFLRARSQEARSGADAIHHQYIIKHLMPVYGKMNADQQRSIFEKAIHGGLRGEAGSLDSEAARAHDQIHELIKMIQDHKVPEDLYNYHQPMRHLHLKSFDPEKDVSAFTELMRVGQDHKGGISAFLGPVHKAIQQAIEHKNLFDEHIPSQPAVRPFSKKVRSPEELTKLQKRYEEDLAKNGFVKHRSPALAGRLVHRDIVPQIDRVENLLRARGDSANGWYSRALRKASNAVKIVDVGANPASTMRRMLSFANQQLINGHFNPDMLRKAIAVNMRHHELYRNLDTHVIEAAKKEAGQGKYVKIGTGKSAQVIPSSEVFAEGSKRGVFGNFVRSEVRHIDDVSGRNVVRRAGHKALGKMFNANEHIDNSFRMATFLDALKKAPKNLSIGEKYDWAADRVRRTHLNFSDLTPFERKYLTLHIPFYAAISRSTPIAYRQLLARPGRVAMLPMAQRDLGNLIGGDNQDPGALPDYLIRNGGAPAGSFNGMPVVLDQKNDITDAYQQFLGQSPLKSANILSSQLNPLLKDPAELLHGRSWFTGAPTRDRGSDLLSYLASQVPATALVSREIKEHKGNKDVPDEKKGTSNWKIDPTLLRALGFGANVVTPKQQKSAQKNINKKKKHHWTDFFTS